MEKYTAVIRTLGKAGEKYQTLLDSLCAQTFPPEEIIVYIAEGYEIPKETCGKEQYVYVKKGMVAQRALPYNEVHTQYMLFLDDDLYLPPVFVETVQKALLENKANIISPATFANEKRPLISELMMTISGRMRARRFDNKWGFKVMRTGGYSYNKHPRKSVYESQTNAGPCFFCRKADFLKIHFEDELWLDSNNYPIGEDQVMFYKMYLMGMKQLTLFHSGAEHLDAGSTLQNDDREKRLISADFYYKKVFFHRFILEPEYNLLKRFWSRLCSCYAFGFALIVSLLKGEIEIYRIKKKALRRGRQFVESEEYKKLPKVVKL